MTEEAPTCFHRGCTREVTRATQSLIPASAGIEPADRFVCEFHWRAFRFDMYVRNGLIRERPFTPVALPELPE